MKKSFIHQQKEISFVKTTFTQYLKDKLDIIEVQGPILSKVGDGMQDNLSGIEHPVSVKVLQIPDETYEVVHSLAKWKRHTLARFGFGEGEGLFVHMKALRPDEDSLDAIHSVYVDQWDWEKVIPNGQRNIAYLKETVEKIYKAIRLTELAVEARYDIESVLPKQITFVHTEELVERYPDLTPKERENAIAKEYTRIAAIGMPFLIVNNGMSNLARADGSPKFSMTCMLIGAIINTILDPVFIFIFKLGVAGAAWATIIGQIVSCLVAVSYLKRFRNVELKAHYFRLHRKLCLKIASLGMSNSLNQVALTFVQIVLNNSLTYYGALSPYGKEIPLAACGIVMKTNAILLAVIIGISQGSQPIIGFNYGAKQYDRVRGVYKLAIQCNLVISLIGFLLFQLCPAQAKARSIRSRYSAVW